MIKRYRIDADGEAQFPEEEKEKTKKELLAEQNEILKQMLWELQRIIETIRLRGK